MSEVPLPEEEEASGQVLVVVGVAPSVDREFFIDNLLVRIHFIIEMILVDRPCTMGV